MKPSDFEKLVRYYGHFEPKESFCGLPPFSWRETEEWLRGLCKDQRPQFVVEIGERIVGHAFLELSTDTREAELRLFIHQDFREMRLGHALLLCLLRHGCKQLELDRVRARVPNLDPSLREALEKVGFRATDLDQVFGEETEMVRPSHCAECRGERCVIFDKTMPRIVPLPVRARPAQNWDWRHALTGKGKRT